MFYGSSIKDAYMNFFNFFISFQGDAEFKEDIVGIITTIDVLTYISKKENQKTIV